MIWIVVINPIACAIYVCAVVYVKVFKQLKESLGDTTKVLGVYAILFHTVFTEMGPTTKKICRAKNCGEVLIEVRW